MDADGLPMTYTYQWIRVDGSTETDITGATADTYTLVADDVGKQIKVRVSFQGRRRLQRDAHQRGVSRRGHGHARGLPPAGLRPGVHHRRRRPRVRPDVRAGSRGERVRAGGPAGGRLVEERHRGAGRGAMAPDALEDPCPHLPRGERREARARHHLLRRGHHRSCADPPREPPESRRPRRRSRYRERGGARRRRATSARPARTAVTTSKGGGHPCPRARARSGSGSPPTR